jgi:hypothetical protein
MSAPVENLVERLHARRRGKGWIAKCPAHDDRKPSLSIDEGSDGRALIRCHAGCDHTAILASLGMKPRDLFPVLTSQRQSGNGATSTPTFNWQTCVEAFTEKHIERLADWRGYSGEFCSWLHTAGVVGLWQGCVAFPVHDRAGKVVAAHYRQKDGSWRYYPQGAKVRPLVIGELIPGEPVHGFESQWDGFTYMDKSGERSGVICTRGSSNGKLIADVLPAGSTLYLWTQNDQAGEAWQRDVCESVGNCTVKIAKTPENFEDLNAWTAAGAGSDELLAAMVNAEIATPILGGANRDEPSEAAKPFPLHCLPSLVEAMAKEVCATERVPESLVGCCALGILSASIGAGLAVRSASNRITRGNIYLLASAESGSGKSEPSGTWHGHFSNLKWTGSRDGRSRIDRTQLPSAIS